MNMKNAVKYLLFDQKQFFEESPKGLLIPALITLIYSLLAVVFILPGDVFHSSHHRGRGDHRYIHLMGSRRRTVLSRC